MLAAQAVAPGGRVIHSDFSEAMVEVARARVDQAGVDRVEFRVIDAEQIDLPDGAVDAVICRMGYMLMADPAAALRETQRVLAPDGRVGLAVWSTAEANPWAALAMRAVGAELGTPPPPPDAPGTLWSLADPARLTGLMEDARLRAIDTELLDATLEFESAEQWIDTTRRLAGPLRALFANVDDDTRVAIERRMRELAEPYIQPDGGVSMPQQMLVAAARK
jgi:SAM-dependent methyltransferase